MVTVASVDGNPARVVLLIPEMKIPFQWTGAIKGKFIDHDSKFIATRELANSSLVMHLSEWLVNHYRLIITIIII